jgi:hypothetical protein
MDGRSHFEFVLPITFSLKKRLNRFEEFADCNLDVEENSLQDLTVTFLLHENSGRTKPQPYNFIARLPG